MEHGGVTVHFARWVEAPASGDIPPDVHRNASRAMLDTLAVMIAGGAHGVSRRLAGLWPETGGRCGLATGGVVGAETAALINGSAAHFWDFDDTSYTGIMHGSAVVFPGVLALAQETGATEEEARTAFVAGSDITNISGPAILSLAGDLFEQVSTARIFEPVSKGGHARLQSRT